ncbi:MAG: JDVT-CTERM system glutamic-type intramembrane protease [Gammaproteobacteria bacterium]|nr:JDVT-CTERM system glutamic-type intramembrane protease [Gammaproteobacteria bacterium]MDH5778495.1 JDVT-CTERM system glutamic-type intramembrane protease [Gammaproteobacteria bacterium]
MIPAIDMRLRQDRFFWIVQGLALIFWWLLYLNGRNISGPEWFSNHIGEFFLLALAYPILEETVFRGLLQGSLWQTRFGRMLVAGISLPNIIISVIFTALHFIYHPPLWALAVFVPSLIFGFFRDRYQQLFPAIYLHVFFNAGYFLLFGN